MIYNPYSNIDLFLPAKLHAHRSELVVQSGGSSMTAAFKRQIDLWWACVTAGARESKRAAADEVGQLVKFNSASILDSDAWRIVQIELLAMSAEGFEVLETPTEVMKVVSEYAYGGAQWVLDNLVGEPSPLSAMSIQLASAVESQQL
jgi:hypothetical protein